jgi:hypothetical protein
MTRGFASAVAFARFGLLWGIVSALGGCVTDSSSLTPPPPYMLFPVDEMMSCDAITASFRYSAKQAARLEYWLSAGPLPGYSFARFPLDAPKELVDERRRLDALSDLQRYKGCAVLEPGPAVVYERSKLEASEKRLRPPVVLKSRG